MSSVVSYVVVAVVPLLCYIFWARWFGRKQRRLKDEYVKKLEEDMRNLNAELHDVDGELDDLESSLFGPGGNED